MEDNENPLISPPMLHHNATVFVEEVPDLLTPTTEEERLNGSANVGVPSESNAWCDNSSRPSPAWDSTPIAPESFRDQLFLSLAKGCKVGSDHSSQASQQLMQESALPPPSSLLSEVSGSQCSGANCQPASTAERSSKEMHRKAELNRQAQKRFRDRHKVYAHMMWCHWRMMTQPVVVLYIRGAKRQLKPSLLLLKQSCSS